MNNAWALPTNVVLDGVKYRFNADYRDILQIIEHLNNPKHTEIVRWLIAMELFYEDPIPKQHQQEALEYLAKFISYGEEKGKQHHKLMDWEQDAQIIIGDINKVAGFEIRNSAFLHWWTFLTYFYGIGEGMLSSVVSIRNKKAKRKKLEKWEQEYYNENKEIIDFHAPANEEAAAEKQSILKWLD